MKNLGIYIHIPFCKKKCRYCDFVSYSNKESCIENYINALKKEIQNRYDVEEIKDYKIDTIYIGGGTPSLIDAKYIEDILQTIRAKFNVLECCETTIEVNPGSATEEKLKRYIEIGINRLSIGMQSTDDNILKEIGRIHTYEEFLTTYNNARKVGFKNINVDLMLGLPNQTMEILQQSINKTIELKPEHISVYSLILEDNTPLKIDYENNKIELPDEELERKMYWMVKKTLEKNNYKHYEISNFAKDGFESKHNMNCWNQHDYLGFGLASHSYFKAKRYCNTNNLEGYIKNIKDNNIEANVEIQEVQNEEDMKKEFMLLGLRKIDGIDIQEFKNRFIENPIFKFHNELEKLSNEGLVEIDLDRIRLTYKGLDLANIVWEEFV